MTPDRVVQCRNFGTLREKRVGICVHYDDSSHDEAAVAWFSDPSCRVSYNWLVLRTGELVQLVPEDARAWHAGVCEPSDERLQYRDANSGLYGLSIAASEHERATDAQLAVCARVCAYLYGKHGWRREETWRITGHADEAWPCGRKIDPVGPNANKPVLSVARLRADVALRVAA